MKRLMKRLLDSDVLPLLILGSLMLIPVGLLIDALIKEIRFGFGF